MSKHIGREVAALTNDYSSVGLCRGDKGIIMDIRDNGSYVVKFEGKKGLHNGAGFLSENKNGFCSNGKDCIFLFYHEFIII